MSVSDQQQDIINKFAELEDWEEKYGYLIKLGKDLGDLDPEIKTEKNKISGCQSQVWMHAKMDNEKMIIFGDSDAMIVYPPDAIGLFPPL